ncbi:unnamed protein product, partial [marine sediment metagenome]
YGNSLDLVSLKKDENGINFVSRTSKSNGISGKVKQLPSLAPFSAGLITVALSGNPLESFLHLSPFYTAFHIMVLSPNEPMTMEQKIFYCHCIRLNKYKYSYGRQANSTLKDLLVPSIKEMPEWVKEFSVRKYTMQLISELNLEMKATIHRTETSNKLVPLLDLFTPVNGIAASGLKRFSYRPDDSYVPYLRPSYRQNTSFDAYVSKMSVNAKHVFPKGTLYVSTNGQGSHTFTYVSVFEFIPNSDVCVLLPKRDMSILEKLYYAKCITDNRYKFSYGRKPKGDRLQSIMLPEYSPPSVAAYDMSKVITEFSSIVGKL